MRIKNKYLRNRLVKIKARNRAKKFVGGEFSLKCSCYWWYYGLRCGSPEEEIKDHQKWIDDFWVRYLINGGKGVHGPKEYRQLIERCKRHSVKQVINEMTKDIENVDDMNIPHFIEKVDDIID